MILNLVVNAIDKFRTAYSSIAPELEFTETKSDVSTASLNEKTGLVSAHGSPASTSDSDWENIEDDVDTVANDLIEEYDDYFQPTVQLRHIGYNEGIFPESRYLEGYCI